MATNNSRNAKRFKNPDPVIPGQEWNWQVGGENQAIRKIYTLLRDLEKEKISLSADGVFDFTFSTTPNDVSGAVGPHINDLDITDNLPLTITWETDGNAEWEMGLDFTITNGRRDFILLYDKFANSLAGADVLRVSHENDSSNSLTAKFVAGRTAGTPRAQNTFWLFDGGDDTTQLSGVTVRFYGGGLGETTPNAMSLVTRSTANNRVPLAFGDALETFWVMGSDLASVNDKHYYWFDNVNSKTRMFIKNVSGNLPAIGFGTTNPQGFVSAGGSSAAAEYNVRQRYFIGSTTDDPGSRSINIEGIRDATVGNTVNYVWLMGGLGGGSSAATRVATSSGSSLGLEGTDTVLSVVVAGTGSDQTILRPLQFSNAGAITLNFDSTLADGVDFAVGSTNGTKIGTATTQKLAFFNSTPIVQPSSTTDLRQALINLGLYATGGATPLDLNGGNLTVNAATINADSTLADGVDWALGSTNGTKIGTATTQKIGFWNATPVVQQANASQATINAVTDASAKAALQSIYDLLKNTGLAPATA